MKQDMSLLSEVRKHRDIILNYAQERGIADVRLFGSVLREEETSQSDIDLLVSIEKGYSYLDMIRFGLDVEKILSRRIDVVPEQSLHWFIRDEVLKEAQPL